MLFTTLEFCVFLAVLVALYYLLPKKAQWCILLLASGVFYALLARRRIVFMGISVVSTWLTAQGLAALHTREKAALLPLSDKAAKAQAKKPYICKRQMLLALFLLINLGGLFVFKFYNITAQAANGLLPKLNLLAPIGISFYTLQIIGYVMDVYHKKVKAEPNLFKTALFTMFFPQIIEGPIARYDALAPQLYAERHFEYDRFVLGLQRMLWGYFKKLVIADRFHVIVSTVFTAYSEYKGFEIALVAVLYTVQLYADFSGGIDIARGAAELFGISLAENFKRPFFAKSVSEFWRRWHITLGAWLRDYVFYPVTLSRPLAKTGKWLKNHCGAWAGKWIPAYIALFILWLCNGVWHGDGLQYIAFGLYHGTLIMLGMSFEPLFAKGRAWAHIKGSEWWWKLFCVLRTFAFVCYGELIFRSSSLADAWGMTKQLFAAWNPEVLANGFLFTLGLDVPDVVVGLLAIGVLLVAELCDRQNGLRTWVYTRALPLRWGILLGGIAAVVLFGIYGPSYDPTPFIYFKF